MSESKKEWKVVDGYYPGFLNIVGASYTVSIVTSATDLTLEDYVNRTNDAHLMAAAPDLLEALAWALPLAKIAMEDHRMGRLRAGHDMTGTYKSGETWVGIYQDEIDKIEYAEYSLAKARGQQ